MGDSARHPIRTAHGCVWWRPIAVLVIFTALAACDDSEKRVVEQVNRAVQAAIPTSTTTWAFWPCALKTPKRRRAT